MAPKVKILRRFDKDLPGLTRKTKGEKKHPPGQHGQNAKRRDGDYGVRLIAKQILRFNYGVSEKCLKKYYKMAYRAKGDTGHQLLTFLESRLDNMVFRAGFAPTIPAARQLVSHGHVKLNGQRVNKAGVLVSVGDEISLTEKAKKIPYVEEAIEQPTLTIPEHINVDKNETKATVSAMPTREDVPLDVNESYVVEYYAKVS